MDKISTLSVAVTEEINPKKLSTFFQTQIKLNNCFVSKKSCYYYSFIPELLRYELIVFKDRESAISSGMFLLSNLCKDDKYTLFILQDYFCLYKEKKLLFFKQVSDTSAEDIKSYMEQTYQITVSHTISLEKKELEELIDQCDKINEKKIFKDIDKVISSNSLKYFIYYCLILFFLFSYLIYGKLNSNKTDILSSEEQLYPKELIVYKKHQQLNEIDTVTRFVEFVNKNSINVESIKYMDDNFAFRLTGESKELLLKLLEYPHKKLELRSIKSKGELKPYIMEVILNG